MSYIVSGNSNVPTVNQINTRNFDLLMLISFFFQIMIGEKASEVGNTLDYGKKKRHSFADLGMKSPY